jgi:hypothetical protein
MPSMPEPSASITLQAINNSTFGANTLKAFLETPLHFEKASLPTNTGISVRYTPLNKHVVNHENGTANGLQNGGHISRESSLDDTASSEDTDDGAKPRINGELRPGTKVKDAISTEWPQPLQRPPGLRNFANTCYMNSTLQALMHVPPLVTYCLSRTHDSICMISRECN